MTILAVGLFVAAVVVVIGFACWLTRRKPDYIDDLSSGEECKIADGCKCGHPWNEHYEGRWCLMDGCECDLVEDDL